MAASPGVWPAKQATLPMARLAFRYGPVKVPAYDYRRTFAIGEKLFEVARDRLQRVADEPDFFRATFDPPKFIAARLEV